MLGRQDFFLLLPRLYAGQESDFNSVCPNVAIKTLGRAALRYYIIGTC
jgi:hypothetical protein